MKRNNGPFPNVAQKTFHEVLLDDSRFLQRIPDERVDLIVTSPPYPVIEMWDAVFSSLNPRIRTALDVEDGSTAFEAMHEELDKVWAQCYRALKPGGFACINIGDATRTLGGVFQLWSNHSRILTSMSRMGFSVLPDILWRKQTNAPNKFMGSGMLPPGAYVTYEHEYVLIFRKGANRVFKAPEEKENRNRSAFFWEERNAWFSDVWTDLKGTIQELASPETRGRSGAYPFELAYRLVNMFSVASDTVLDPFLGTGTTMAAAIASGRNSLGVELDAGLADSIRQTVQGAVAFGNERIARRLSAHRAFVEERAASGRPLKHQNRHYGFPVMTRQEMELVLLRPRACSETAEQSSVEQSFVEPSSIGPSSPEPSSPEPSSVEAAPVKPVGDLRFEVDYSSEEPSPSVTDLDRNFHCSPRSSVVQLKQGELEF